MNADGILYLKKKYKKYIEHIEQFYYELNVLKV